jgi:hypothetical protein
MLGFFRDASSLLHEMLAREAPNSGRARHEILVVDYNPIAHQRLRELGISCIYGDIGNLEPLFFSLQIDLSQVQEVICTLPDHTLRGTTNLRILRWLRGQLPDAKLIMTGETIEQARELYKNGADYVYAPRIHAAKGLLAALDLLRNKDPAVVRKEFEREMLEREEVLP